MVLRWIGRALIGLGTLILLFLAYQLWGTGFITSQHQTDLKHRFYASVAKAQATPSGPTATVATPVKPSLGDGIALLEIPRINLGMIVVEGTSVADLKLGPGHYTGTPLPGDSGNVVISGHRTTYKHPFYNLNDLVVGDPIYLTNPDGIKYTYLVTRSEVVAPDDIAVISNTTDDRLTLTTCNPRYSASQRLIVTARLQGSSSKVAKA